MQLRAVNIGRYKFAVWHLTSESLHISFYISVQFDRIACGQQGEQTVYIAKMFFDVLRLTLFARLPSVNQFAPCLDFERN